MRAGGRTASHQWAADDVRRSARAQHFPLRVAQISRLVAQFNQQYTLFCPANKKKGAGVAY